MLYIITQNDIRKDNPSIDAIPEFAKCNDRELKYVVLTYDYDSPYRKLKFADKQKRAATAAGYKKEKNRDILDRNARIAMTGGNPKVQAAIIAYKETQRDMDKEILLTIDQQIELYMDQLRSVPESAQDWNLRLKINKEWKLLVKDRQEIATLLSLRGEEEEELEEVNEELSTLDKLNQIKVDKG